LNEAAPYIAELCESYSLTVLHLEKLNRENAAAFAIAEYEELCTAIEEEASYFLQQFSSDDGIGRLIDGRHGTS